MREVHAWHACFSFLFMLDVHVCFLWIALGGDLGVQDQLGSVQREKNQVRIHPIYAWKYFVLIYWVLIDFY